MILPIRSACGLHLRAWTFPCHSMKNSNMKLPESMFHLEGLTRNSNKVLLSIFPATNVLWLSANIVKYHSRDITIIFKFSRLLLPSSMSEVANLSNKIRRIIMITSAHNRLRSAFLVSTADRFAFLFFPSDIAFIIASADTQRRAGKKFSRKLQTYVPSMKFITRILLHQASCFVLKSFYRFVWPPPCQISFFIELTS